MRKGVEMTLWKRVLQPVSAAADDYVANSEGMYIRTHTRTSANA